MHSSPLKIFKNLQSLKVKSKSTYSNQCSPQGEGKLWERERVMKCSMIRKCQANPFKLTDQQTPKNFRERKRKYLVLSLCVWAWLSLPLLPYKWSSLQSSHPFELQVFIISLCVKDLKLPQVSPKSVGFGVLYKFYNVLYAYCYIKDSTNGY